MTFVADVAVFGGITVAIRGLAMRASARRIGERAEEEHRNEAGPPPGQRATKVSRLQVAAMKPRVLTRIRQAAAPYLEVGELVNCAFFGQTGMPTGYAAFGALIGPVTFVIVVATDRNVVVFRRGISSSPRVKGLLARYRIEPDLDVSFGGGGMRIDSQTYWVAALMAQQEAMNLVEYVRSVREARAHEAADNETTGPD